MVKSFRLCSGFFFSSPRKYAAGYASDFPEYHSVRKYFITNPYQFSFPARVWRQSLFSLRRSLSSPLDSPALPQRSETLPMFGRVRLPWGDTGGGPTPPYRRAPEGTAERASEGSRAERAPLFPVRERVSHPGDGPLAGGGPAAERR